MAAATHGFLTVLDTRRVAVECAVGCVLRFFRPFTPTDVIKGTFSQAMLVGSSTHVAAEG